MNAAITLLLGLITKILPLVSGQAVPITSIIQELITIMPTLIQAGEGVYSQVQSIIATLQADPATTPEQIAALEVENAKIDALFEDAAKKAEADDTAAGV